MFKRFFLNYRFSYDTTYMTIILIISIFFKNELLLHLSYVLNGNSRKKCKKK